LTVSDTAPAVTSPESPLEVSVIVPAWNEAENIPLLVPRIAAALKGRRFEILIVDDGSADGTPDVCGKLTETFPLRLLVRNPARYGLSGAVLEGIAASGGATIVVMDADLQHPPERIPALLEALDQDADFALGSRYVPGGSTDDQWTFFRKINSGVATALARPFAGTVRDPMSGFFALRRSTFDRAKRLTPLGYKIALELMCKCRVNRVQEVPIHFGMRTRGQSKLTLAQQFKYLEHLSRLYDFTYPRASPILKFLITVVCGFAVGLALFGFFNQLSSRTTLTTLGAYLGVIAVTAVFHIRYVRTQKEFLLSRHPWRDFSLIALAELVAVGCMAHWLNHYSIHVPMIQAFVMSFACGVTVRYVLRKELMHDIRGLRKEIRAEELI
jgi:dolichol-phosphate mannosyltransferase